MCVGGCGGGSLAGYGKSFNETNAKHNTPTLNNSVLHCSAWAEISLRENAEEKNNTRLESLKVIEAVFCYSIKRTLQKGEKGTR